MTIFHVGFTKSGYFRKSRRYERHIFSAEVSQNEPDGTDLHVPFFVAN